MHQYVAIIINLVNAKLYSRFLNSFLYAELADTRERKLKKIQIGNNPCPKSTGTMFANVPGLAYGLDSLFL